MFASSKGDKNEVPEDCITDKSKALEYFGTMQAVSNFNQNFFIQDAYGDERVEKRSVLRKVTVDSGYPSWIGTFINR